MDASKARAALVNRTNIHDDTRRNPWTGLLTPPGKRPSDGADGGARKRAKLASEDVELDEDDSDTSDSDVEMEDVAVLNGRARKKTVFRMLNAAAMGRPSRMKQPSLTTRPILQTFVSSHKADVYKCHSIDPDSYLTLPYACAYSNGAKNGGGMPLLAVATEQGSVHILNTSKRRDWDFEPCRTTLQPHHNGIFDVRWNASDTLIATASGDTTTRISCATTNRTLYALRGHKGTVKCVGWDPIHTDLLCTGGRDGDIRIWDLRVANRAEQGEEVVTSVARIEGAHVDLGGPIRRKGKKGKTAPRSVTNVLYPEDGSYSVISSGSYDGILRHWDLRLPASHIKKSSKSAKATTPVLLHPSPSDPTARQGSRPRGIVSLTRGSGPTAGLLFALGADSRVHTYDRMSLQSLTSMYTHAKMQTNSFYVSVAMSPCGKWLANGGTTHGSAFLFDVSNAASPLRASGSGVELQGAQKGEVGALDWAAGGVLAACAEDGTVRVWRPDEDVYSDCVRDPGEAKWGWSWAARE